MINRAASAAESHFRYFFLSLRSFGSDAGGSFVSLWPVVHC